ncbi:MAG: CPBP family intramembrane metalloprotease [Clostridium sp.]|nr:CPBP family intramembrane metalloprotease [Clostridium sp.]
MGRLIPVWSSLVLAAVLWTIMFSPETASHVNFWLMMSLSACVLTCCSFRFNPHWWRQTEWTWGNVGWGIVIAVALWIVFWTGNKISAWMFAFARPQVDLIYGMKDGCSPILLSVLLLCLIGPAEEIFWRGYVQRSLSARWNPDVGFLLTSVCYTLVHVGSLNFMLLMAALVAGLVWGMLYRLFPNRLSALIFSHALWDAAVFVWFPI